LLKLAFAWFAAAAFGASLGYFLYAYLFLFNAAGGARFGLVVNVLLFTLFALHHSLFARSGIKEKLRAHLPERLERAVYTLVASILFAAVCWFWRPLDGTAWTLPEGFRPLGYSAQLAGIVLTLIGARALDVWELAGVRQVLPAQQPAAVLKTNGLYGFVRHPLYFAWVLLVFGAPDMTMTRLSFAIISTLYLALAIPFEERSLSETFGPDYASYRKKVRWRMVPGLY
jgi:methanethiol S-methyltransferase